MADMETMDAGTPRQPPHMMDEGTTEGEESAVEIVETGVKEVEEEGEDALIHALGITSMDSPHSPDAKGPGPAEDVYDVVPNPDADVVDLSDLRGTRAPTTGAERHEAMKENEANDDDLEALAELVPELKARSRGTSGEGHTMTIEEPVISQPDEKVDDAEEQAHDLKTPPPEEQEEEGVEVEVEDNEDHAKAYHLGVRSVRPSHHTAVSAYSTKAVQGESTTKDGAVPLTAQVSMQDSMQVQQSADEGDNESEKKEEEGVEIDNEAAAAKTDDVSLPSSNKNKLEPAPCYDNEDQNLGGFDEINSDKALDSDDDRLGEDIRGVHADKPADNYAVITSSASLSTATQTHEVRMPMYLPTFKPATGCTNASDFIVRCFVARLRSGITVVKHGRSRWCKSRLRILHIHPDGRSLSWKPALGEPTTNKRPPKLDLSTCMEVRHAWSPDPLNPMFTGTMILRQKCEAANAHKSFALIFPKRTVDITAVTADQCKVLMEGFSALCFRLQVANLAGRGSKKGKDGVPRGSGDEEEVATTASVTLTNNSTQLSPSGSGGGGRSKRKSNRQ